MDDTYIYKSIQRIMRNKPLLLLGCGASAAYGIPNINELGAHILQMVEDKYPNRESLDEFRTKISSGVGLEDSLADSRLEDDVLHDIKCATWKLISERDLELFKRLLRRKVQLPLVRLFIYLYKASPQRVDIVSTQS